MEADYLAQLEPLAQERAQLRYDALKGEADEKLGDAQADIDSAEAEILDAQTEIEENEATLADSEQEILDGEAALEEGKQALGFTTGEILAHYMRYNALCALLGVLLGWGVSVGVVEILVLDIFNPSFLMGTIPLAFSLKSGLLSAAICLVVFLASGYGDGYPGHLRLCERH